MLDGTQQRAPDAYVGPDRRQVPRSERESVDVEASLWLAFALIAFGVILPAFIGSVVSDPSAEALIQAERGVVSAFFLGAGLLRLARWRLTGESNAALSGVALAAFALTSYPLGPVGFLVYTTRSAGLLNPLGHAVAVTIFLALLVQTFRTPAIDSRLHPLRLLVATVVPVWLAYTCLSIVTGVSGRLHVDNHVWVGLGLLLVLGWGYVAGRNFIAGARAHSSSLVWTGLCLATMGVSELVRSWAFLDFSPAALSSTGLQLVAAFVAAANAAEDLGEIFSAEGNRFLSVVATLARAERTTAARERRREEQVHDARSVIAALRATSLTLERYGENLDPNDRQTLRSGFVRELARLEHLIEPPAPQPPRDFVVDDALQPVIAAEREAGLAVQSTLNGLRAHGRPEDLATVVHNLLVNARRYAPGSPVVLRAEHEGSDLRIYAEDRGPGIAPGERDLVFQRGVRGATTADGPGSGLGLYVAQTLMKEQGGEIGVTDRPGGGASFVLTMPAAAEPARVGSA